VKKAWLFLSLLLVPCGSAAQETPQPSAPADEPACAVTLAGADLTGWKEVRATGFTFCVPGGWRPSGRARNGVDARTWRSGSSSVAWGTEVPERIRVATTTTVVVVTDRSVGGTAPPPPTPMVPGRVRTFSEVIGGTPADLWDNEFEGVHYTGAKWSTPRPVYVTGESRDDRSASIQLQVYRTVRFMQP
jgi:hypothetical protein